MLIKQPQVHILSKEVVIATGELVRVYFAVIDTNGVREIRFLGTKPCETHNESCVEMDAKPLCIEAPHATIFGEIFVPSYFETVSPFYTLDFLTSQLARAPSVR